MVQSCGHAYRLRAGYLMQEFDRGGFLMNVLLRFAQSLITQMAQTAVCNRHHSIDQQLCRWFAVRIIPYRRLDNMIDGVVVTLVDISASKALESTLRADAQA